MSNKIRGSQVGKKEWVIVSGTQTVGYAAWTEIGTVQVDPIANRFSAINLVTMLEASELRTAYLRLYNVTDGYEVAQVNTVSNVPLLIITPIVIDTVEFPLAITTYSVQIKVDNISGVATCKMASLEIVT